MNRNSFRVLVTFFLSIIALASAGAVEWNLSMGEDGPFAQITTDYSVLTVSCSGNELSLSLAFKGEDEAGHFDEEMAFSYAKDVRERQTVQTASVYPVTMAVMNNISLVIVPGAQAKDVIDAISSARVNIFVSVKPGEGPGDLIFHDYIPAKGSTSAINHMIETCS